MDEIKLRKYRDNLITSGQASIIFSLWSILRFVLFMILNPQYIEKYFVEISEYEDYKLLIWVVIWIIFFVFFLIIFLIHLYVGKSAVKEAKRGKNKYFYLIIAFVMISTSVSSIRNFMAYDSSDSDFDVAAVSIFMDITSAFLYIDMIYSSIRTKLLKRKLSHSRT